MSYKCINKKCDSDFPMDIVIKMKMNCCPICGDLLPATIEYIDNYFRIIQLVEPLEKAKQLFLKSETVAAVREAIVVLEETIRNKSGLFGLMGSDLMAKSFSFKFDPNTDSITDQPKIKINDLSNVTERNEQDGMRFFAMGIMQGIRNTYMHTEGTEKVYYCLQIITSVDLLLKQVLGWKSIASS